MTRGGECSAAQREQEPGGLDRRQRLATEQSVEDRHDRAEGADRGDDAERAELGGLVEADQPTRIARSGDEGDPRVMSAERRGAIDEHVGEAGDQRGDLRGHQHGDERVALGELGADEVRDPVTGGGPESEDYGEQLGGCPGRSPVRRLPRRQLGEERIRGDLALERRQTHVTRVDHRLARVGVDEQLQALGQRRPIAARQIDAADRALEEDIAADQRRLVGDRVGQVADAVAGGEEHIDVEAGDLEVLAAGQRLVGVVALVGADAGDRGPGHDVGEHRHLELRAVDGRARRLGHRGDGADVIDVRVSQQDRLDVEPELVDRGEQARSFVARVDHDGLLGTVAAEDVGVLGERSDGEAADVHPGQRPFWARCASRSRCIRALRRL